MLLTDNNKLLATCNLYKHDGRKERGVDKIEKAGLNCRFTELQAAVGLAQVKKINFFIKKKKEIYKFYAQEINKINNVEIFKYNKFCNAVPHRIIIFVKNNSNKLIRFLTNSGIGVRTLFLPMHNQPAYNQKKKFLVSNKLFLKGVCLPSSPKLTKKQILFICNKIKYFYDK
jgi:dTDP-4-amino-4,6-dideoxygalactose transaminase